MTSIMKLIFEGQKNNISFSISIFPFDSLVARARNAAAAAFLNLHNHEYLLFIDSDIAFEPSSFFSLLSRNKDLISGLYPKKYISHSKLDSLSSKYGRIPKDYESICTDFATEIQLNKNQSELEEVNYAATGFMLVKRNVFEQIIKSFPNIEYKNDIDGYSLLADKFYNFFDCKVNKDSKKYESEDYGFCSLYKNSGGRIFVDTTCSLTHYGIKGYSGNFLKQSQIFS